VVARVLSLTLYGPARYLVPNPIDRYAIEDRPPGLRYRPVRIVVSDAPRGRFLLYLRLDEPERVVAAGRWTTPTVTRKR